MLFPLFSILILAANTTLLVNFVGKYTEKPYEYNIMKSKHFFMTAITGDAAGKNGGVFELSLRNGIPIEEDFVNTTNTLSRFYSKLDDDNRYVFSVRPSQNRTIYVPRIGYVIISEDDTFNVDFKIPNVRLFHDQKLSIPLTNHLYKLIITQDNKYLTVSDGFSPVDIIIKRNGETDDTLKGKEKLEYDIDNDDAKSFYELILHNTQSPKVPVYEADVTITMYFGINDVQDEAEERREIYIAVGSSVGGLLLLCCCCYFLVFCLACAGLGIAIFFVFVCCCLGGGGIVMGQGLKSELKYGSYFGGENDSIQRKEYESFAK